MADDFKDYPPSLALARAEKNGNASLCPVRDIVVDLLREIDNGLDIDLIVIGFRAGGDPKPRGRAHYRQAGGVGFHDSLGLMDRVRYLMQRDADV